MAEHQKYMRTYEGPDCMEEKLSDFLEQYIAAGGKERVLVVHDEMIMGAFESLRRQWQGKGAQALPKKTQGPTVMVSEFLSEMIGPMVVKPEQWEQVPDEVAMRLSEWYRKLNGSDDFSKSDDVRTRVIILPGKSREGYWTGKHVVMQVMHLAIELFELIHPGCEGVFMFDNSSCHGLYADNALVARKLNAYPGRKQHRRRTGWFERDGQRVEQSMVFEEGDVLRVNFSLEGKKYKKGEKIRSDDARLKMLIDRGVPKGGFQVRPCRMWVGGRGLG